MDRQRPGAIRAFVVSELDNPPGDVYAADMKSKNHPTDKPRGVRDARKCKVQQSGKLVWIRNGQSEFWTDRPYKFAGHIKMYLRKPGTEISDIKWKQLGSETWWRLPEFQDGEAGS